VSWPRLRLWAIALFGIGLAAIVAAPVYAFHDFSDFWAVGHLVGTPTLVDVEATFAWQREHGLSLAIFPYPPGVAWLFWPFAQLPLDLAFWLHTALMLACAAAAGWVGAGIFGLPRQVGVLATLAWAPVTAAMVIGQNTPLALLLATLAIDALVRRREWLAGGWVAALTYKPTLAAPLAGLFLLRGRWRALIVVAAGAGALYLLGIPAVGGDPGWPRSWLDNLAAWLPDDAARNADKAVSLPGLLDRLPVPWWLPYLAGLLVVLAALPRLLRAPLAEAAAGALLVGVAVSPHAWSYEAALMAPIIWWALAGGILEPWRTRLIVAAYLVAPLWLISGYLQVSTVAVLVLGATVIWVGGFWRADSVTAGDAAGDTRSS
jgi:hypothetical protein